MLGNRCERVVGSRRSSVLLQSFLRIGWDPSCTLSTVSDHVAFLNLNPKDRPTDENTGNKYASMISCRLLQWVTLFLLTTATFTESRRPPWLRTIGNDFVCTRVLPDGEVERRIQKGRISAIETTVELAAEPTDSPFFTTSSQARESQILTLLQVTDGRHFIQLIYDSGWDLRDCEYLKSAKSVDEFFEAFASDVNCPLQKQYPNETRTTMDPEVKFANPRPDITDYGTLRRECRMLHKKVREMALHNHHHGLQRLKRDLFLYPGTNWCGSGSNARKFNELGYNAAADRCCRDHDHCPYTIEGFTRKFNFFNFRFHTISHCDCDERFRACLKLSSTAAGNMVGKLFFNVVQTKCFLFKHVKKCGKRSWWGKCLKYEKEKSAFLRDALKY
ncbi:group 3 secretory phospholipase A2 [Caerostris darwini]|uniref:Phospholipase A2 n=1 Tax=Caerostris darwini TaxID=1538125 RepID=A0AAV4NA10_9ARAC|nr:group 3 secretory phospholipase A2 [Caerostris darwini]